MSTWKEPVAASTVATVIGLGVWFSVESPEPVQQEPMMGQARSSAWNRVRLEWLQEHGECAACGQKDDLNVHHKIPFRNDPTKELDKTNLITLCTKGPGNMNCHLVIGHAGNYRGHNPNVERDAERMRQTLKSIKF